MKYSRVTVPIKYTVINARIILEEMIEPYVFEGDARNLVAVTVYYYRSINEIFLQPSMHGKPVGTTGRTVRNMAIYGERMNFNGRDINCLSRFVNLKKDTQFFLCSYLFNILVITSLRLC